MDASGLVSVFYVENFGGDMDDTRHWAIVIEFVMATARGYRGLSNAFVAYQDYLEVIVRLVELTVIRLIHNILLALYFVSLCANNYHRKMIPSKI